MQPCSREMQAMNSLLNPSQIPLQEQQQHSQIQNPHFDPTSHDYFLEQMLSTLPSCSWADPIIKSSSSPWDPRPDETASENVGFHSTHFSDEPAAILASKLRLHQISGGSHSPASAAATAKMMMQQQQMMMMMPLSLGSDRLQNDVIDGSSSFKSPNNHQGGDGLVQALYNGFSAGQAPNQPQHFHHPQAQNFGAHGAVMNQAQAQTQTQVQTSGSTGDAPAQPRQRVRARRGQATDPHSIAERLRRERIAERMKALQELVPNANKTDKASMLDEIIDYVKFLQLQVKVLSMSRLGGAAAVAPLVADMSSEGGGGSDCIQATSNGGSHGRNSNGTRTASSNDSLTVTEHQVAKLMEDDMGSAMQFLQGKGLCLMPISLATAISTATCHSRNPMMSNANPNNNNPVLQSNGGEGSSSPSMSVLTVQSATMGNGSVKDGASVSKP